MSRVPLQTRLAFAEPESAPGAAGWEKPEAWSVHAGWAELLRTFWSSPQGASLAAFIRQRAADGARMYPSHPLRALSLTGPEEVRVVILGQDPYHGPGQAEGLAFSVAPGVKPPPSLRNIFKEIARSTQRPPSVVDSLLPWAAQGVLLLNTCLTVEDGRPASHAGQGWETLTDAVIRHCSDSGGPKAFLLWGAHAQRKAELINPARHRLLCANHPSPLSASRGPLPFLGCSHFTQTNAWLVEQGLPAVQW